MLGLSKSESLCSLLQTYLTKEPFHRMSICLSWVSSASRKIIWKVLHCIMWQSPWSSSYATVVKRCSPGAGLLPVIPLSTPKQWQLLHYAKRQLPTCSSHQKWQFKPSDKQLYSLTPFKSISQDPFMACFSKFYAIVHFWCQDYLAVHLIFSFVSETCHFINQSYSIC